uniref:Uncharacterized protein n=1 Tax=Anguilla anguilla TaxID=7936 RepID=A0A0E9RT87_ANGAN
MRLMSPVLNLPTERFPALCSTWAASGIAMRSSPLNNNIVPKTQHAWIASHGFM